VQDGSPVDEVELAASFARMARILVAEPSVTAVLQKVTEMALVTISGCDHAGVSLIERSRITTPAASDELPRRIDEIQYRTGEGPCLDAIRQHHVFETDDVSAEARWPNFSAEAAATGVRSMLSFRLYVDESTLGALNLFSRQVGAFRHSEQERTVGVVFSAHAALALEAKGILMAQTGKTEREAFEALRRASQLLNVKLRLVAEDVTLTGQLPPVPDPRT
jgi:transcriptional regulator with GAF, ATPase, and Fis domain